MLNSDPIFKQAESLGLGALGLTTIYRLLGIEILDIIAVFRKPQVHKPAKKTGKKGGKTNA